MGFILKNDPTLIRVKLTNKGRELLSRGKLNFTSFAIGDSEIDYEYNNINNFDGFDSSILRPKDENPNIVTFIEKTFSGDTISNIGNVVSNPVVITNTAKERGFFIYNSSGNTFSFNTAPTHMKQPHCIVDINTINGGTLLNLYQSPLYGSNINEPEIGDYVLIKWTNPILGNNISDVIIEPIPYLFYKIHDIVSGTLGGNNLIVEVDRELPNFNNQGQFFSNAYIYPNSNSGSSIQMFYSSPFVSDFLNDSVFSFIENYVVPTQDVPVWNMSIVFTEEIAGVLDNNKKISDFITNKYSGFVQYIQKIDPIYKKIGIIHYSNKSPANHYGEGFVNTTPILELPTIMWHKNSYIGLTLSADTIQRTLPELNTLYYNLVDENNNVVGKVFNDLKLFIIEDQELLFAMSYKSNRNWTLPKITCGLNLTLCPDSDLEIIDINVV